MAPCTIKWCGNSSQTCNLKKNGITFHRFPKHPNLKEKWINATRRENWFPSVYSVICSRHFEEDCFINMKNSRRLLSSAVPTLCLPILTNNGEPKNIPDNPGPSVSSSNIWTLSAASKRKSICSESPSNYNTPITKRLCRRIIELREKVIHKNRQIKNLREKTSYLRKKITSLESKLKDLEKQHLINSGSEAPARAV
ncbi:unnamed protein product [Parnassius apollo]|uniref:(apollo) hypothetical protein n=1 Tax=Parnassius apollo TaxID=110799 RepID=A0A8S3YCK6_PARAO|nr:unnamed protein product [Parnassius apollo]